MNLAEEDHPLFCKGKFYLINSCQEMYVERYDLFALLEKKYCIFIVVINKQKARTLEGMDCIQPVFTLVKKEERYPFDHQKV